MSKTCYFVIKFYHKTSINGKLVSRSLMLILIGMATAQNIQAGERMSMPTSFKKQTTGLSHVSQQTISVKGNVRDQSGEPMAGVNVIVEGTTIGTMTDSNGNFTLNVPSTSIKSSSHILDMRIRLS